MKKRTISLILVVCFLVCLLPSTALAAETSADETGEPLYNAYSAIGDSICAGFAQLDYNYTSGMEMNIEDSPEYCYVQLVGRALGLKAEDKKVYNLGKLACDTEELLDILTNEDNSYHNVYLQYIKSSDLVTLEIGADDLAMAALSSVLQCLGPDYANIEPSSVFYLLVPFFQGDFNGMVESIKTLTGVDPTPEQIKALMLVNSDEVLGPTLEKGYQEFIQNFPTVVDSINSIIREYNPDAQLVIINNYNPYYGFDEALGSYTGYEYTWKYEDVEYNYNIGEVLQVPTEKMNDFLQDYCDKNSFPDVDISDVNIAHLMTNGLDPHPNNAGHAYIAAKIVSALANSINATAEKGGTITPSGTNVVKNGESRTFTITPDSGYLISDVKVDSASVGAVGTYTFENVTSDHEISASFKLDEASPPTDGTVYYKTYTALGDSITAGYSHDGYDGDYSNPKGCYVELAATSLGVETTYNLGLLGQKSGDLLDVLTNPDNEYHDRFAADIAASNLVTIDIGSNDITMALLNIVFKRLGKNLDEMTPKERMNEIAPLLAALKSDDVYKDIQKYLNGALSEEQIKEIIAALQSKSEIRQALDAACTQFDANWDGIIAGVRAINPTVSIVALGLYDVAPQLSYGNGKYDIETLSEEYITKMNEHISKDSEAVKEGQYIYVDTMGTELITSGFITVDPHPSDTGHKQIAAKIKDAVLNDITASGGDGVTVSPNGTKTVAYGRTDDYSYTYTFTPTGGTIKDIFVDGSKVDASSGSYTFSKVTSNHTISVTSEVVPIITAVEPKAYYSVTPTQSAGGSVTVSPSGPVLQGTDVTIFITPDPGYEIDYITLDGQALNSGSVVTIKSIAANHSVYAAFKTSSGSNNQENPFKDIKSSDWFYEAAMYGYINGIIKGTSGTTFDPDSTVNLAMIRTLLYQLDKEPSVTFDSSFSFVASGKWYTNAFIWSIKNGISIKTGASQPGDKITREEIVTLLYLYAKYKGYEINASTDLKVYTDSSEVSDWAEAAMQWAVAEGLIKGTGSAHLAPEGTATRAEVAELIYRFITKYGK